MKPTYKDTYAVLRKAAEAGLNVLLEGPHGTGKTAVITAVARDLDLKLKYYSASTLDPFVDVVGLPVPHTDAQGNRTLAYHRLADLDDAQLVFFDELNRAQPKVQNAVFEMIQFHTINGEPLPRLRAVFAACNPASETYDVIELDPALVGRFHVQMEFDPGPDPKWFSSRFGKPLGEALYDWWAVDLDDNQQRQVNPRALEHIGMLLQHELDLRIALTPSHTLPLAQLQARVTASGEIIDIKDFVARPEHFAKLVESDINVAMRFLHLLPRMKPAQFCTTRYIILSLPAELLATAQEKCPFVLKKAHMAISKRIGRGEADAFRELVAERTATTNANRKTQ